MHVHIGRQKNLQNVIHWLCTLLEKLSSSIKKEKIKKQDYSMYEQLLRVELISLKSHEYEKGIKIYKAINA